MVKLVGEPHIEALKPLEVAQKTLDAAQQRFEETDNEYRRVGSERTTAINALNQAQKAFDKAVDEVRKNAPRDSDWTRNHPSRRHDNEVPR